MIVEGIGISHTCVFVCVWLVVVADNSDQQHKAKTSLVLELWKKEEKRRGRYLVDPASSHMLVLKIKPCMP